MRSAEERNLLTELNCLSSKRIIWIGSGQNDEDSGVDRELSRKVVLAISSLDSQKEDSITLIVNCSGGDEIDGLAIYDAISLCRSHVTAIVCGAACSAASVFIQAADLRLITPNSYIMIHDGTYDLDSERARDSENNIKLYQLWKSHFRKLLNSKSKIPRREFSRMMEKDTWMDAKQALEYGFVDKIIEQWGEGI